MAKCEVIGRYRGSILGLGCTFFYLIFMLLVFTFVFSVVFKIRRNVGAEESKADFAVVLFVGLMMHG